MTHSPSSPEVPALPVAACAGVAAAPNAIHWHRAIIRAERNPPRQVPLVVRSAIMFTLRAGTGAHDIMEGVSELRKAPRTTPGKPLPGKLGHCPSLVFQERGPWIDFLAQFAA